MPETDPEAIRLYGESRPVRRPVRASAGPIQFVFEDGMIKCIRLGNVELVRRLYFAVRDDQWDTIYPEFSDVESEAGADGFRAIWTAECRREGIHYRWTGSIEADAEGTIRFTARGAPERSFRSNRIGLCLLLPTGVLAGQPFTVIQPDDGETSGEFPEFVQSDLLAERFKAIRFQPPGGPTVQCEVEGAHFDMEDQRLYIDTTFKAYAPLPYAYPQAEKDEAFAQTVTFRLIDRPAVVAPYAPDEPVDISIGGALPDARIPELGLTLPDPEESDPLTDREQADLAMMKLGHLRVVVDLHEPETAEQTVVEAARLTAIVARGLLVSARNVGPATLDHLRAVVRRVADTPVKRLLIKACDAEVDLLPAIRLSALSKALDVRIGGPGSADVSGHPAIPLWAAAGADFLCWAGSPAIHQEDDETLMENTAGVADQIRAARRHAGDIPLAMGPFRLDGAWPRPRPDPRYTGRFAAAWVASVVKHLGENGVLFATLFEATGAAGVLYRQESFSQPGFDGAGRSRYPSGDLVTWLSRTRGALFEARSQDPLRVEALAVLPDAKQESGRPIVLLINKTFQEQSVRVQGVTGRHRVHVFTDGAQVLRPDPAPGQPAATYERAEDTLKLLPYGLAWLVPE